MAADQYDHAINLVDTTKPDLGQIDPTETNLSTEPPGRRSSDGSLHRRLTKGTLREELARRKYAKYQESRYNVTEESGPVIDKVGNGQDTETLKLDNQRRGSVREGRLRDRLPFRSKKPIKAKVQQDYEVDILYENQRGSFFCGIPLYSSRSLLNFDPSAWQTENFKESPVNITNAQVPDPTWVWAWKSWYVDMSHDVDEEGWEYSLSFRQGFSWHGTHPWFHSFVRRRRWLRKRVKRGSRVPGAGKGAMSHSHMLNADYFTIHPPGQRSRASSADGTVTNRSSYVDIKQVESDNEIDDGKIVNIVELMDTLKEATVDRKKAEAIKNFLEHGGDELYYLPVRMDEIMALFLYQTSRRQLLSDMQRLFDIKTQHRKDHESEGREESDKEKRKTDSLLKAVQVADEHVKNLEYWSDVNAIDGNRRSKSGRAMDASNIGSIESGVHEKDNNMDGITDIRGIPEDAGVNEEPGINWDLHQSENEKPKRSLNKGKEKAVL